MTRYIFFICFSFLSVGILSAQCVGEPEQIQWFYFDDLPHREIEHLYVHESFPNGPDDTRILNSVGSPSSYNINYGSMMKGFISVPMSGPVTFNVTGNDDTYFHLSTNASSNNLIQRAFLDGNTGQEEHDKFTSQTSAVIDLNAGQLYYFEIYHRQISTGDHAQLYWKTNFLSQTEWTLVRSQYLTATCDPICPTKGTSCNDGNPNTVDDMEDGNCHCIGQPTTNNSCVGERGLVQTYFYYGISSGTLTELYTDPDYPTMPAELVINPKGFFADLDTQRDYGVLIQGYLTVPVSGDYQFNLTGRRNVRFKLSTNDSTANIDNTIIDTQYGSNVLEHDKDASQTSGAVSLIQNTYYYFEFHLASTNDYYSHGVFWKGPSHADNNWHRIPAFFLYDYACELACLPNGQQCDDGNAYTANDQMVNCACEGTPCGPGTGVACDDPSIVYETFDYCETTIDLDNREDDAWISCQASQNPFIPSYSNNHWIYYDLGQVYELNTSHVWNYNVAGATNQGFNSVAVDYSVDGNTWFQLGTYTFPFASGDSGYTGFVGPNFNGESARYVVFTSLDSPSTCRGLSKITFNADLCPPDGSACDDGSQLTQNDYYKDCLCRGFTAAELNCQVDTLYISEANTSTSTFHAIQALISDGEVLTSSDVNYLAGMEIILQSGFEVSSGTTFLADIEDCGGSAIAPVEETKPTLKSKHRPPESLHIYSLESLPAQTVHFYLPKASQVILEILDQKGNVMYTVINHYYQNYGNHYKRIQTGRLEPGVYVVRLTTDEGVLMEKMVR